MTSRPHSSAVGSIGEGRPADPLEALRAVRRHWRIVALFAVGLPLVAAAALSRVAPTYKAKGTLLYAPVDFNPKLLRGVVETGQVTASLMASQVAVLKSPAVMRAVVDGLDLVTNPAFNPALAPLPAWRRWLGFSARRSVSPVAVRAAVQARFGVAVPGGSQLINVTFDSTDPRLAARAVNAAMTAYLDRQRRNDLAVLDRAQAWLTDRAAATARRLESFDVAIARARAASGTERGAGSAPLTNQAAGALTDSLVAAETDLAAARARLAAANGGSAAVASAAVAGDIAPMRAREAGLVARLHALSSSEGPNYPSVRATKRELAALRGQIAAETRRLVVADRARMQADRARVDTLKGALAAIREKTASEAVRAAPLARLEDERAAESSLLRAQTRQIGTLESQSALTRPDARIIARASPPEHPSAPRTGAILGGTMLLGLCVGVLAALAADVLNGSFRSGGQVREALELPCMALLPEVKPRERRGLSVADYARRNPFSPFAEQIRALRTGLWLAPGGARSLAITAARPGEGKTTLTVSLALSLAASGKRVLVIDCDIRQPSFDMVFGLGGLPGLTDHLAGRVALDAAIHRPVLGEDIAVPDVMPAGAVATDALTLFMSERLPGLMTDLQARYDLVILDLPPVFALAEAQVLARAAAATLLCIRWGQTPRRVVAAARTLLDQAGIRLAGAALTRVDGARHARAGFPDSELYHPRYGGYFRI